jgi:hypothetical protein
VSGPAYRANSSLSDSFQIYLENNSFGMNILQRLARPKLFVSKILQKMGGRGDRSLQGLDLGEDTQEIAAENLLEVFGGVAAGQQGGGDLWQVGGGVDALGQG